MRFSFSYKDFQTANTRISERASRETHWRLILYNLRCRYELCWCKHSQKAAQSFDETLGSRWMVRLRRRPRRIWHGLILLNPPRMREEAACMPPRAATTFQFPVNEDASSLATLSSPGLDSPERGEDAYRSLEFTVQHNRSSRASRDGAIRRSRLSGLVRYIVRIASSGYRRMTFHNERGARVSFRHTDACLTGLADGSSYLGLITTQTG